ncbi:hypothetical protein Fot_10609 [Forsythia ovata]|uniref:Uncharacterized protein n=1 Tax=Forsythia ovata TaxID=205694 RepID=A0ABD1WHD3_9LAMI
MATSSPFVLANSSSEKSSGNSSRDEEVKKERISRKHEDSGKKSTKGKLFSAPVSSLKRSKSDDPLVYHEHSAAFIIDDDVEISKCISFRSLDGRTLKFDFPQNSHLVNQISSDNRHKTNLFSSTENKLPKFMQFGGACKVYREYFKMISRTHHSDE